MVQTVIKYKRCQVCRVKKAHRHFSAHKGNPDGLQGRCKNCSRNARLLRVYGLTPEQYESMLRKQGGVCAICKRGHGTILDVDHCHKTGRIRGLLCRRCNTFLGLIEDASSIEEFIRYLAEDEAGTVKLEEWSK